MRRKIEEILYESIEVKKTLMDILEAIEKGTSLLIDTYKKGGRVFLCGNGGSAADAQHIAGELVVKFKKRRNPLSAFSLCVDPSVVTATSNDFGYEEVFSRQIEAHGKKDDLLIALSTSGRSKNVNNAVSKAREMGLKVIYITGPKSPSVAVPPDLVINVASNSTARIQEAHITICHIMVELLEETL